MRIAIIGTGGVGGYLGAKLWNAGNEVVFIARGEHLDKMKKNGLKLFSPDGDVIVHSTFCDTLDNQLPFDLIIVAVKSFDTHSAASIIKPIMADSTIILSIQNGVENEYILANYFGHKKILAGIAYIFSIIKEDGVIKHQGGTGKFIIGELNGKVSDSCLKIEKCFQDAGIICNAIENIQYALWKKWIFICGLGGMTAYAQKTIGEIISDDALKSMLQNVVVEAASIARGEKIDAFIGVEDKTMEHFHRLPYRSTSSMYHDFINHKRIEIDAINGAVVRMGKELKIATPANETICNTLKTFT